MLLRCSCSMIVFFLAPPHRASLSLLLLMFLVFFVPHRRHLLLPVFSSPVFFVFSVCGNFFMVVGTRRGCAFDLRVYSSEVVNTLN